MSSPSPDPSAWTSNAHLDRTGPDGTVTVVDDENVHLVRLTGEIDDELRVDLEDAAAAVAERRRADPRPVHVDATAVSFMDSTGAAFLAKLAVTARPDRVTIDPSETVAFLLDVTRLSDVLDLVDGAA